MMNPLVLADVVGFSLCQREIKDVAESLVSKRPSAKRIQHNFAISSQTSTSEDLHGQGYIQLRASSQKLWTFRG
jgi:hypothetical protein